MKQTESPLAKHIGSFFSSYLSVERGASPHTIRSYANTFVSYIDYMERKKGIKPHNLSTASLVKVNVLGFLAWIEDTKGVTVQTRNQRLAAIHSLCRYLQHSDITHIDRWQEILSIKFKKAHPKPMLYLSVEGVKLLLSQVPTDSVTSRRNLAMLALLYDTGARVQELVSLRPCDLHLESPAYLILQGKGNKSRAVPIQDKQASILQHYISENKLNREECQTEPLFKNRNGSKLTGAGVTYLLMKYVTQAHEQNPDLIPERLSPHCLRHSKAMHLLQAGVNLVYIRDILGHVSIMTTEIYARADSKQKREALEAAYKDVIPDTDKEIPPSWETNKSLREWLKSLGIHTR